MGRACVHRERCSFEGQAAMELEHCVESCETSMYEPDEEIGDWRPALFGVRADMASGVPPSTIAAKIHNSLADVIVAAAAQAAQERVVLSGGCFQNRVLTERVIKRLRESGFEPCWHQRVPPNDGGLAVGQAAIAALHRSDVG